MPPSNEIESNGILVDGSATGPMIARRLLEIAPGQRSDMFMRCSNKPIAWT